MSFWATLGSITNTSYILFCFMLGIWSGVLWVRGEGLSGNFWGAMWTCTILAAFNLIVWLARALSGEQLRFVYALYELYFVIVLPGTFALLRGRDDRTAAGVFAAVTLFSGLAAISAADPSRNIIAPLVVSLMPVKNHVRIGDSYDASPGR
jgi:hypothetical protein